MKKNKDHPTSMEIRPVKRKSDDMDTGALKLKKRKKHQNANNIPKKTQGTTLSTKHLTDKKIKLKVKNVSVSEVSPKQKTGIDNQKNASSTPDRTSAPASNESGQTKKKKKKKKKLSQQAIVNQIPSPPNCSDGAHAGTVSGLQNKKKKKPHKGVQNLPRENAVSSNTSVKASVPNTEAKKKKKNKPHKGVQNLARENVVSPNASVKASVQNTEAKKKKKNKPQNGVQILPRKNVVSSNKSGEASVYNTEAKKKKKKPNPGALNVSSATDDSGSTSPSKSLQKKTKNKLHNKNEKKNFSEGKGPFLGKQNKKENKGQNTAKPDSSKSLKNKNTSKFGQPKGNGGKGTDNVQVQPLKGRALKRHIDKLTKTISKLKDYKNTQAALLLKATSEEKKKRIQSQLKKIKMKIRKLESDVSAYQNRKPQNTGPEIINRKVYRGLPEDPPPAKKKKTGVELKEFLQNQMKSSRFRWLNENLYTSSSEEAQGFFKDDPESFKAYHEGYSEQVSKWPVNPLDVIIKELKSLPKDTAVADLGCGEAKLAAALPHLKVHSLDFIALKPEVIACDMAHCPLLRNSVGVAVFCLSLMGTNVGDFLLEANRILKIGGTMEIAEVESRFESIDDFIEKVQKYGFKLKKKNPTDMFFFLTFKKTGEVTKSGKLPELNLKACVYKKR